MDIQPRKELEKLLKDVKAKSLLETIKKLDQKGRDIVVKGINTNLTSAKKDALLSSLRQEVTATDSVIREWLVNAISESYVHGMNMSTKIAQLSVPTGTKLFKWSDATPQIDTMWERIRAVAGNSAGTMGNGVYFSLDPNSSKMFGNQLHSFSLPNKYKLIDLTKGTTGIYDLHPLQKDALRHGIDVVEEAKRQGYDGVIFRSDDGQSKWVALNNETARTGLVPFIATQIQPMTVELLRGSSEFSPHISAINALLNDAYLDFGNSMTSFMRSGDRMLSEALKRQIRSNLVQGRLEGEAMRDIAKTVKESFINKGFIGLTDRSGREWTIDRYAEMVTRTHIMRANNEGAINRAKDFFVDVVEVSSHASACPICQPYEGKFYSISGTDKKYPPLAGNEPPYHPNCKHSLYYRPDLGDDIEQEV